MGTALTALIQQNVLHASWLRIVLLMPPKQHCHTSRDPSNMCMLLGCQHCLLLALSMWLVNMAEA